jgi:RNA polymerase sigma-70 factor, ECF subfamily
VEPPLQPSHPSGPSDTSRLLNGLVSGDLAITQEFVARIHAELRKLAARHMAGQRPDHTLQPTALVNEVWARMFGREELHFEGRRQFYAFASRVMRSVLVDHARTVEAAKRGGDRQRLSISVAAERVGEQDQDQVVDLLDLDAALVRLKEQDADLARVVELRYFGGLQNATVAEVLGVSERTVERQWRLAKAWLFDELSR